MWPLLVEEPTEAPPSTGGGGRPVFLPRQPVPRLAPIQRVRVRYGPARITGIDLVPIRFAAHHGPAQVAGHTAAAVVNLEASTGPGQIVTSPNRTVLTVRAARPDDDLEVILLAAAALWE